MDLKKLESIMKLMRKHKMHELSLESAETGEKLSLVATVGPQAGGGMPMFAPQPSYQSAQPLPAAEPPRVAGAEVGGTREGLKLKPTQRLIKSPFVGTFYASPSPDAGPFVKVGQKVKKGDVLCIIEAMKLMNEIEAEADGVLVEILVQNEQPIEYDQPLFILE